MRDRRCWSRPRGELRLGSHDTGQPTDPDPPYLAPSIEGGAVALIGRFEGRDIGTGRVHDPVDCGYRAFSVQGGRVILQLETYGRSTRAEPGKVSQSLQLDQEAAEELIRIIRRSFPSLA